jgi:predicted nucleic acid-binding protein
MFCDTSAVAKLYVAEAESPALRERLEGEDQVFISELARTELMGVFHRQLREKIWSRDKFLTAIRQFNHDDIGGFWTWLPVDNAVVGAAAQVYMTLPETVFLRSADCLHLVTALRHNFLEICTYDVRQSVAAGFLGLKPVAVGR